jgi:hypothetical protein
VGERTGKQKRGGFYIFLMLVISISKNNLLVFRFEFEVFSIILITSNQLLVFVFDR